MQFASLETQYRVTQPSSGRRNSELLVEPARDSQFARNNRESRYFSRTGTHCVAGFTLIYSAQS